MKLFHLPALSLLLTGLLGCGSSGSPSSPTPALTLSDLVGSWTATSVVETNQANTAQTFDIIAAGGELRFTMLAGGGTRTWITVGTFSDEWDAAVTLNGRTVTSVPVEAGRPTTVATATLVNGVLTLTDTNATFDFTFTGATPVKATQVATFVRSQ
jgi:hypothetical protein